MFRTKKALVLTLKFSLVRENCRLVFGMKNDLVLTLKFSLVRANCHLVFGTKITSSSNSLLFSLIRGAVPKVWSKVEHVLQTSSMLFDKEKLSHVFGAKITLRGPCRVCKKDDLVLTLL